MTQYFAVVHVLYISSVVIITVFIAHVFSGTWSQLSLYMVQRSLTSYRMTSLTVESKAASSKIATKLKVDSTAYSLC